MPNKEPGAIRQLFAFVGERNSKMRISIFYRLLLLFIFIPNLPLSTKLSDDAGYSTQIHNSAFNVIDWSSKDVPIG